MARQQDQQQSDPAVAAIERVLKIERDGVQQLRQGQERAQDLLAAARAQAAAITAHADARISRLHNAYLQKVQRDIERLQQSTPPPDGDGYGRAKLAEAARRIAAKLTGEA